LLIENLALGFDLAWRRLFIQQSEINNQRLLIIDILLECKIDQGGRLDQKPLSCPALLNGARI